MSAVGCAGVTVYRRYITLETSIPGLAADYHARIRCARIWCNAGEQRDGERTHILNEAVLQPLAVTYYSRYSGMHNNESEVMV